MAQNPDARRSIPVIGPFLSRPFLLTAILLGVALYFACAPWVTGQITRALVGWNSGVTIFLCLMFFLFMRKTDIATIKQRAITHDEGGHFILLLTIFASIASVGALVAELSLAKDHPGQEWRVGLAAATVILSWLFVQLVFGMHYAHLYYLEEEEGAPKGGLEFGQCGEPDYWDFFHFAIVMGATSQTADITFTSKEMRRVGTLHTLVAFGFNTAILATMINLAANFI
ncbi:MAG TPA: DUF1345 domain-containing protein [Rhizomicrobium sp.]|nr:DUF1345 domain-containing protein [Rhizomicrobium sp.]